MICHTNTNRPPRPQGTAGLINITMVTQIKKKNLFKFFKSNEFNRARVLFCAVYILLSYVNELVEEIMKLLQGFDGLFVGMLKHEAKNSVKAFEAFEREYRRHIFGDGGDLCDATIDVTKPLDMELEQSKFFLQESTKAVCAIIDEQIEKRVTDPEQLEREAEDNFEICGKEEREQALFVAKKMSKNRFAELGVKNEEDLMKGVEVGFNIAVNWINRLYLEA